MEGRSMGHLKIIVLCTVIVCLVSQIYVRRYFQDEVMSLGASVSRPRIIHAGIHAIEPTSTASPEYVSNQRMIPTEAATFNTKSDASLIHFSSLVTSKKIDRFQVTLPPLLPDYKNPCWMEAWPPQQKPEDTFYKCALGVQYFWKKQRVWLQTAATSLSSQMRNGEPGRLRCFPDFYLLGVTKCGTTEIFRALAQYGNNFAAPLLKEAHFWGRRRSNPGTKSCRDDASAAFTIYMDIFDKAAEVIRSNPTTDENGTPYYSFITGDFSPTTLNLDHDWQTRPGNEGLEEPAITTAHYIRHLRPGTRFIVIMRDPVKRFYSNICMNMRLFPQNHNHTIAGTMRMATDESLHQIRDCRAHHSLRACTYRVLTGMPYKQLTRGLYHVHIRDWLEVFPRDQFLFLTNDNLRTKRLATIQTLLNFLGLDDLTAEQISEIHREDKELAEASKLSPSYPPIDVSDEKKLRDFYRPHIEELVQLIGDDAFNWTRTWD